MASKKSVLITGCSEGSLGDALAQAFHNKGFRVFATARNPAKIAHFAALGIETVILDVASQESINTAAREVSELTGGALHILFNNSGIGYMLPVVDMDISKVREIFDINVTSNIAVIQGFLPLIRKAAPGSMIVNNTSVASVLIVPLQTVYSATKAAMTALTHGLRLELEPFGIKVVEVKTGSTRSKFFDNSQGTTPTLPPDSIYQPAKDVIEVAMGGKFIMAKAEDADVYAKQVVEDLTGSSSTPLRIWRGAHSWMVWFLWMLTPYTLMDPNSRKMSGMDVLAQRLKEQKKLQ